MSKLTLSTQGPVAVLTMDDGKANTFDTAHFKDWHARLDEIEKSDASTVLITGRAGYLSAGLDLRKLPTLGAAGLEELIQLFGQVMLRVFTFPRPVVAAITGHAMGAGAILSMAADLRFIAQGPYKFGMNEVQIGMTVPTFGIEIGRASAPAHAHADMVLHGRTFSPDECAHYSLVEKVLPQEDVVKHALDRANGLASLNMTAYADTKRMMRGAAAEIAGKVLVEESRRLTKPFVQMAG